jgi:hypothetical protein
LSLRYDEPHQSQQFDRIVAWETAVVTGEDIRWTTFKVSWSHLQVSRIVDSWRILEGHESSVVFGISAKPGRIAR